MEGFFNKNNVGAFQDDVDACALWIWGTVYIKCPLVLLKGVLKVVDEVEQVLGFDGAVWFITNVEFSEFNGLGWHLADKVRLLKDFLDGIVGLDNDVMVLEIRA